MNDTRYLVGKKNGKWYIRDVEEDLRWNDMTLPNDISKVCMIMNEQDQEIEELRELLDIGETNAKSILDVLNYQQSQINKTIEVLQKHYNYAYDQRQKNLDNAIVAKAYDVLRGTVDEIANELGIEIKR